MFRTTNCISCWCLELVRKCQICWETVKPRTVNSRRYHPQDCSRISRLALFPCRTLNVPKAAQTSTLLTFIPGGEESRFRLTSVSVQPLPCECWSFRCGLAKDSFLGDVRIRNEVVGSWHFEGKWRLHLQGSVNLLRLIRNVRIRYLCVATAYLRRRES